MTGQDITVVIGITTVFVLAVTALLIYRQTRLLNRQVHTAHMWNRQKETLDFLTSMGHGRLAEIRDRARRHVRAYDPAHNYAVACRSLSDEEKLRLKSDVISLLNSIEQLGLGIRKEVFDRTLAYECLGTLVTSFVRWAQPLIDEFQAEPRAFVECCKLAAEWSGRLQSEAPDIDRRHSRVGPLLQPPADRSGQGLQVSARSIMRLDAASDERAE